MKKVITLLSLTSLFFVGCNAKAQTAAYSVGNPDSANALIIQQGYEAVAAVPAAPVQPVQVQNQDSAAFPGNANNSAAAPAAPAPAVGSAVIESVTTTTVPGELNLNGAASVPAYQ